MSDLGGLTGRDRVYRRRKKGFVELAIGHKINLSLKIYVSRRKSFSAGIFINCQLQYFQRSRIVFLLKTFFFGVEK
jgi:hypothetical protein